MGIDDKTRVVGYSFDPGPEGGDFVFNVEKRLSKAKIDGIITNYDDGRNRQPWFQGKPSKKLRKLRDEFRNAERKP